MLNMCLLLKSLFVMHNEKKIIITNNVGDFLTLYLAQSSGENYNLSNTLVHDQNPISLSCALCLVLISKCYLAWRPDNSASSCFICSGRCV